ncbi:MAG: hypothetical protein WD875_00040 [Pirellulales bacterium]
MHADGNRASIGCRLATTVAVAAAAWLGAVSTAAHAHAAPSQAAPGEVARCERHSGTVRGLAISADGKYVASVGDDRMCYILNAQTLKVLRQYGPQAAPLTGVAFMRDMTIVSSGLRDKNRPNDGTIRFWDWNTAELRRTMPDSQLNSYSLVLSPDEKKIGIAMGGPSARMYHVPTDSRMGLETPWPDRKCNAVAISPDSNLLAAGVGGGIALWHISDEKRGPSSDLQGDSTAEVNAIEFSPDGKSVVAAHADGVLRRWNIADGALVAKLPAHTGAALDVAISPDGKQVASGGEDKLIRIWDAESGKESLRLAGHSGAVTCVAFSADSKYLYSAAADGTVRLWSVTGVGKSIANAPAFELIPGDGKGGVKRPTAIRPAKRGQTKAPDSQRADKATALLKDVYADDLGKAGDAAAKQKLAGKLLAFARDGDNDAAERFAAFQTARDLLIEAAAVAESFEATADLAATFAVDDVELLTETAERLGKSARTLEARSALVETSLRLVDETVAAHRFAEADRVLKTAEVVVRLTRKPDLVRSVREAVASTKMRSARWSAYQAALENLKADAADAKAHLVVGRYLLFVDGNWQKALPHLAKSSDEALKSAAAADLAGPTEPDQQIAAAELWEKAGETASGREQQTCQALAAYWYQRALPALTGLRKVKVEKALKAMGKLPTINRGA